MRILYFSNISFSPTAYNGGGWIFSLINELKKNDGLQIGVCFIGNDNKWVTFDELSIYETQKLGRGSLISRVKHLFNSYLGNYQKSESKTWPYYENLFCDVINDFNPDIIHIFGSEKEFGLIGTTTDVPIVLHIQGYINPYIQAYLPPFFSYSILSKWYNIKDVICQCMLKRLWKMQAYREKEIFNRIDNYIGRTEWDKRITLCYRPDANYFYGSEVLRNTFYLGGERKIPQKLIIVSTISGAPYKGFDMVLKTANVLRNVLNLEFEWKIFGNVNPVQFEKTIGLSHKDLSVSLQGVASAEKLKEAILSSTCYLHPTYIDNSPNSVCEAQILGVTVIACNVGGISSLIENGKTGFLIPSNDSFQAAYLLKKVYDDVVLNMYIGSTAKETAFYRHDKDIIVKELLSIYKKVIDEHYS